MAGFIGGAMPVQLIEARNYLQWQQSYDPTVLTYVEVGIASPCWSAPMFVRGGGFVGAMAADVGILDSGYRAKMDNLEAGSASYGFVGVTRDQYGSPLGSVTVLLFRASGRLFITSTTSDASGNFTLATPYYPDAHFIVYQKSGSPDVQGVSVFTLIGT